MTLPFQPQKLQTVKSPSEVVEKHGPASMEPKLDGWHGAAEITETGARIWNRSGTELTAKLPHVRRTLAKWFPAGTLLEGELCTKDDEWGKVQSVLGCNEEEAARRSEVIQFAVFDMLALEGRNLAVESYSTRRQVLEDTFFRIGATKAAATRTADSEPPCVRLVPAYEADDEIAAEIVRQGFEGVVVKVHSAPYAFGKRGRGRFRVKDIKTIDVVAMGFEPGKGERGELRGLGAIIYGQMEDGVCVERGRCGGGFSDADALEVWQHQELYEGRVFELAHFGIVSDGSPRHPQFRRWRDDKTIEEATWDNG